MQYLLTEEELLELSPQSEVNNVRTAFNDARKRLEAFGKAINEHPDGQRIWERQREILVRAEEADPELFAASAMLPSEKDEFGKVLVDYGKAEYKGE